MSVVALSSAKIKTAQSFSLEANQSKQGAQRLFFVGSLVVLALFSFAFFYDNLALRGVSLIGSIGLAGIALILAAIFYFKLEEETEKISLRILNDGLQIVEEDKILHQSALDNLSIQQVKWGMDDENCLPALQIKGDNFPKIVIGTTRHCDDWIGVQSKVSFTDYLMVSEKEWNQLAELLV